MKNEQEVIVDIGEIEEALMDVAGVEALESTKGTIARIKELHPSIESAVETALERSRLEGRLEALRSVQSGEALEPTPFIKFLYIRALPSRPSEELGEHEIRP